MVCSLPEEGEYSTLSGYLVMTMGDIPEENVEIVLGEYKFILESVSNTKIETVRF
ncbi:MAG: transporter associated domain-containing protein [Saprospiraceae bacterium]